MKLSVVVPIFKDAYLAKTFINELVKVDLGDTKLFEIIFVIDGGNDDDKNILYLISKNNPLVKVIVLSRNFGQHIAISAGYANTSGDYICYINVDMQDPPSEIDKLLKVIRAEDNIDIVLTPECGLLHIAGMCGCKLIVIYNGYYYPKMMMAEYSPWGKEYFQLISTEDNLNNKILNLI